MPTLKNRLACSEDTALEARVMLAKTEGFPVDDVPENQAATLSVDLGGRSDFNNRLFGVNFGWHVPRFRGTTTFTSGFNSRAVQNLISQWQPPEIRWGDGVFANFYNYTTDRRAVRDDYKDGRYYDALQSDVRYGFNGFARLKERLDFDTIFTWNINYNTPQQGVERLLSHNEDGLEIDRIELGNELFFADQRAGATRSERRTINERGRLEPILETRRRESEQIRNTAREHYRALKAVDPSLQISIPVSYRTSGEDPKYDAHPIYNDILAEDQSFYDAVSLHRYLRPRNAEGGRRQVLDSRRTYLQTARTVRQQFPDKPIWLTEFAINAGDNAITALGLADTYLGFIDNPDLFDSAEYFQANSDTDLLNFRGGEFTKTTLGATYDTLREVFEDSTLLDSDVQSTKVTGTIDSVSAEVAEKDNEVLVYAVNKSPHEADFNLEFDGVDFNGAYELKTFEFDTVEEFPDFQLDESAFKNPTAGNGSTVKLPGLSMSLISIDRSALR
jgi:hypothetical protein